MVQLIGSTQVKIIYSLTQKNMAEVIEKNIWMWVQTLGYTKTKRWKTHEHMINKQSNYFKARNKVLNDAQTLVWWMSLLGYQMF
jgi:hypothetical protein